MPTYFMNEAMFELPDVEVHDHTAHALDLSEPGREDVSVVVARGGPADGATPQELASRRVREEQARLLGYSSTPPNVMPWGDGSLVAAEVEAKWRHQGRVFCQRQAHLVVAGAWIFVSVGAPINEKDRVDAAFDRLRATYRAR